MRIIRNAAACASGGEDSFFTEMYTLRIRLPVEVFKMYDRLTKGDIEKMEREIEERKLVKRPELIEAVKEARAQGDLSENFEYYAAKREKNQNESRIRYLERMIRTAEIVEDHVSAEDADLQKNGSEIAEKIRGTFDYNNRAGAVFLGTKKLLIKAHGAATEDTITSCILQAVQLLEGGFGKR